MADIQDVETILKILNLVEESKRYTKTSEKSFQVE